MQRICVFCGSSPGLQSAYVEAARALGVRLAAEGIGIVYGGSDLGVMGALAATALAAGGEVIGVIPRALHEEVVHPELTELHVVETMHDRKAKMFDLSDAFIALPGGVGTLEEFVEVLTWAQLRFHTKPCGLLNVAGYYDKLLEFFDYAVAQRFVKPKHRAMVLVDASPEGLLARLRAYRAPDVEKWLDRS